MRAIRLLASLLGIYLGLVVAFESLVVMMGRSQAARGLQRGENWLIITTTDASGSTDTVVAGVESGGQLYVAANHWPHAWYSRAIKNPDVEITRGGERLTYRAVPVTGEERVRIAREYSLPWAIRLLTGFPPRSFLRLEPR
jgi:F420H(2)-dependent quinone reductase